MQTHLLQLITAQAKLDIKKINKFYINALQRLFSYYQKLNIRSKYILIYIH